MTDVTTTAIPLDGCDEQFLDLLTKDVDIPYGRFNYPCRLKLNPEAEYLSVQLHGNAPRGTGSSLPVFARWNWGKVLGAHVLSICDPTLYLDDTLTIGWYLGNKEESAIPGVVAIAERCADEIGIAREQIIYSGGSGGGFAALQAAALAKDGKAIAINPQTDLLQFLQHHVGDYVIKASGCASMEEAQNVFGDRWNAIRSLHKACARGNTPKIVIVQNRNEWHYVKHFTPFTEAFGLNRQDAQSINGNFMSILYDGPREHGPESSEVVKQINNEGIPFLLSKKIDTFIPDISTQISLVSGKIQAVVQTSDDDYQFACYLRKDDVTIVKQFYSSNNTFTFNLNGPGKYSCQGFIKDNSGRTFFDLKRSAVIHVTEADVPAVKNDDKFQVIIQAKINNEGVPFLLGEKKDTFTPDFSTLITLASGKIQAVVQTSVNDYQFACYLCKDGVTIEKKFYSSNNTFTFNFTGPGKYSCRGFIRDKLGEVFSEMSAIIPVTAADILAVK